MTGKIFRSIFAVAVSILLACLGILFGVLYRYLTDVRENSLKTMLLLSESGVEKLGIAYFADMELDCRLTWIDAEGKVLYDTQTKADEMENHLMRQEIRAAFDKGEGQSVRYSQTLMEKTLYHALRLKDGTVLRASVSMASIGMLLLGMLSPICFIFLAALVLSMVLAYRVSRRITEPMEAIDLEHPLRGKVYEELRPLLGRIDAQNRRIDAQKKELAQKRLQMEFAEESRREFTANVSHELRTPLQSVLGSAELMENRLVKPEDTARFATGIRKEATRLLNLIEDILHLSRLDENSPMTFAQTDVLALCQEEAQLLVPKAQMQGITLQVVGDTANIFTVPQLMREIIRNLLDNAVKYNKPQGKVMARVQLLEDVCILSVSDTGIGIPSEYQERVFERFFRVDKSHSKATGGTGLGLSIVKHAAAYLKADLRLESESGVGTTITVVFPLAGD